MLIAAVSCKGEEPKPIWPIFIEIKTTPGKQDTLLANVAGVSYKMMDAAIKLRASLRSDLNYRSGIYVYDSKSVTTYLDNPGKLAARITLLGLKDVYLSASKGSIDGSDVVRRNWIRDFNKAAHLYGLTVWALRLFSTSAYVSDAAVTDECAKILAYNQAVTSNEKFDAVSADWEPHVLKEGGADTPAGLLYFWDSNTNYGIGKSNDLLLKRTLDMFAIAKQNLGNLMINEAIHYMYQNNYNSGLLSYGNTLQFLINCEYVTVMCYTDTKEKVWSRGLSPVEAATGKTKKVSICVKTSLNTYGDGGDTSTSLYPKGWDYLIESMNYFYSQGAVKPAFRGIDFFEFEGLEQMWNTTDASTKISGQSISKGSISYDSQKETLQIDNFSSPVLVLLYSVNGNLILKKEITNLEKISINQLPRGNYLVKYICATDSSRTLKLIKK
ncbi:MAG: T9SS type A sorting domain-containing protein [Paludibacter sp.]